MLAQLSDALGTSDVPDQTVRAAADEVASDKGRAANIRLEMAEMKSDLPLLKGVAGLALGLGGVALPLQIRPRVPS